MPARNGEPRCGDGEHERGCAEREDGVGEN
jgi:hypothetical protein